jgi:hypothetical protein
MVRRREAPSRTMRARLWPSSFETPLTRLLRMRGDTNSKFVMAGLDPAIHVFLRGAKNVDARDKPGHDAE